MLPSAPLAVLMMMGCPSESLIRSTRTRPAASSGKPHGDRPRRIGPSCYDLGKRRCGHSGPGKFQKCSAHKVHDVPPMRSPAFAPATRVLRFPPVGGWSAAITGFMVLSCFKMTDAIWNLRDVAVIADRSPEG